MRAVVETEVVWSETAHPLHPSRDWASDAPGIEFEGGHGLSMAYMVYQSFGAAGKVLLGSFITTVLVLNMMLL